MSKKLGRLQTGWTSNPRGKRRVRADIRKAADRSMLIILAALMLVVFVLIILSQ
ncbi:hypothetical protein [Methylobacterium sp. J-092]|uniref:hypothetical protein n=1 Tax=Methylobacterium sp. J-092 TaxID=2836667 RepID=UPI001FBAFA00|nr:hypothetical protein [Methylobacterium sp. J-092]MCJ2006776.1 hypothetical protein [Methylobacterium sp. J-092]